MASATMSIDRRTLGAAVAAAVLAAAGVPRRGAAQTLAGSIRVHFESRGGLLEQEVEGAVATLTGANPEASIEVVEAAAGDYLTELTLSLFAGEAPDVFQANSVVAALLAQAGAILPLDDFLAQWPDWASYPEQVRQLLRFQDRIWGLPTSLDSHFLFYRKDRFAAAGLPVPWQPATLDDLTAAARALKASAADLIPLVLFAGANPGNSTPVRGFLPLLRAFGGTLQDGDGRWIIDSCAIRSALGYYEQVYRTEGLVPESVMSTISATNAMRDAFSAGEAAILFDGCWVWDDWSAAITAIDDTVGFALFPTADGSPPFTIGGVGPTWFINASTRHPDLAWAFVAAMNEQAVVTRLNLDDPHVPPRADAGADPAFLASPFLAAMVASFPVAVQAPPDPAFRDLVGIIQNATGLVATGEVTAAEAAERYAGELERVLGEENVVRQPCP